MKIYNLIGLEICIWNLDLPFPFTWSLPVTKIDMMKEKYIEAKRMQLNIIASYGKKRKIKGTSFHSPKEPKMRKSGSMPALERNSPKNFNELLSIVEENEESNREPWMTSLRRIEAKRRSLLQENLTQQDIFGNLN